MINLPVSFSLITNEPTFDIQGVGTMMQFGFMWLKITTKPLKTQKNDKSTCQFELMKVEYKGLKIT